ncbi:hypothetical protein C8F04DRAFT_728547 [Mycena alexandri]|uniref:F-box domain-containing protein n=1 Tax=Mycena alexandri TaxID=1745969 RepID=A0AAD6TD43_9AGAR|nr:hypothetical protein C8F04DRAFT_728547 [Mycena alexandri]
MDMFNIEDDKFLFESAEEREAREIRLQKNELVPIARLPPEILADIFVRCVPTSVNELQNNFSWLNVTRVSTRWRNVALSCPEFWSTLIFSRPKWTPVMLERSKKASLAVRVDLGNDPANSPEPVLLENASRLGILDIRSSQQLLTTFMANVEYLDAAPRLQCITVVNTDTTNLGQGGMWLPRNLFRRTEVLESRKAGARTGTRLHLKCCAFPWDSGWYLHLTHLHLENLNPAQRPTMDAFLGILVGSPNLQTLTVIQCSPTTRRGFPVELPHLTALTLKSDSSSTCARLLGYLLIPPSATVNASCSLKTTPDSRHALYQSLIPEFSDVSSDVYDTVHLVHSDAGLLVHTNGLTYSLLHSARPEWSRKLRIDATTWPASNIVRVTETVRDYLDLSRVTTLHLQGMNDLPLPPDEGAISLWDTLGRALPRLNTLHLHKTFPTALLEFLLTQAMLLLGVSHFRSCFNLPKAGHGLAFRGPDGALSHAWPGLRCLALHDLDLSFVLDIHPTYAEMLRALLWARREGGAPIWRLEIEDCVDVFTQDLGHFRLFADVVYDGKGQKKTPVHKDDGGDVPTLRAYSVKVFADMIELSKTSIQAQCKLPVVPSVLSVYYWLAFSFAEGSQPILASPPEIWPKSSLR